MEELNEQLSPITKGLMERLTEMLETNQPDSYTEQLQNLRYLSRLIKAVGTITEETTTELLDKHIRTTPKD